MKNIALISAVIYTGISACSSCRIPCWDYSWNYTAVERIGGAFWVFLLSMIILIAHHNPCGQAKNT